MPGGPEPGPLRHRCRHRDPRPARHHQVHPGSHAAPLAHRRVRQPAQALGGRPQPAGVQRRHRQPQRPFGRRSERPHLGPPRCPRARLDLGRHLSGDQDHPDVGRVLGPGVTGRTTAHDREDPRHRGPAGRQQPVRHPRLRQRPRGGHHPHHRPHPTGQPQDPADRIEPNPPAGFQLRPRSRRQRPSRPGSHLHLLPTGPGSPVRDGPDPAGRRAPGRLHQPGRRWLLLRTARVWRPDRTTSGGRWWRPPRPEPMATAPRATGPA